MFIFNLYFYSVLNCAIYTNFFVFVVFVLPSLRLLGSAFFGEKRDFTSSSPITHIGSRRKNVECKESRIGKQPIVVPSSVAITMNGQDLNVKGPLGQLSITFPREVIVQVEESGSLRVRKAVETRRANQMHGLFRWLIFSYFFMLRNDKIHP